MRRYSNKSLLLLLHLTLSYTLVFFLSGCGSTADNGGTASVSLTWDAPTKNSDGTTLTDLAGYRVYYGETSGTYLNSVTIVGNTTTVIIDNLHYGRTIYFTVTAFDIYGLESSYSIEIPITLSVPT